MDSSNRKSLVVRRSRPVRRTQEERSAETRRKLIEAAIQLLHDQGYSQLTIANVAHRAGVTSGAMQHHFFTKSELLLGVLENVFILPALEIPFDSIATTYRTPTARVDAIVDALWKICSAPQYFVLWQIALGARIDQSVMESVHAYHLEFIKRMERSFEGIFPQAKQTRALVTDLITLISSFMRGLALMRAFGSDIVRSADLQLIKNAAHDLIVRHQATTDVSSPKAKKKTKTKA